MKLLELFTLIVLTGSLTACLPELTPEEKAKRDKDRKDAENSRKTSLSATNAYLLAHPELVGVTEDGLVVKKYSVKHYYADGRTHYVYVVFKSNDFLNVETTNYDVENGKYSLNQTTVTVKGN